MALQLSQNDIEKELADVIPHGKRKEIARITHTYESVMYAYLSADDERKSPAFQQLAIQAALDEIDAATGDEYWAKFCALREASRPHTFKAARSPLSIDHELGNLSKEITDVIVAKCEGRKFTDQLREIQEAERQLAKYKSALYDQLKQPEAVN